jgi:hypothetical protein
MSFFTDEGLIAGYVGMLGQKGSEYQKARENGALAIRNIACRGDAEVKKGLFKHEGLIAGLVEILGQKGGEHKTARENAAGAIYKIALGDAEVKAGLFHFTGLMFHIDAIIGDATLNGTEMKQYAEGVKKEFAAMARLAAARLDRDRYKAESELAAARLELAKSELSALRASIVPSDEE